jgi:hypothetical protein
MSPGLGSTPRQTDWLTVSRNVTLTLTFWYQSRLRTQEANIALLTSQPGSARDSGISIVDTRQSLPPVDQCASLLSPHRTERLAARPDNKKKASQPLLSPHRTVRLAAWHSAGTPGFRHLAATHYGPFQGQQTPQPADYDTIALFRANNSVASQPTLRELRLASLIVCGSNRAYLL